MERRGVNHINHQIVSINIFSFSLGSVISLAISSLPELVKINFQNNQPTCKIPRLLKHVKVIYKHRNKLLIHKTGDGGATIGIIIASIIGGAHVLIIYVVVYQFKKSTMENFGDGRTREVHKTLIRGGAFVDDTGYGHLHPIETPR